MLLNNRATEAWTFLSLDYIREFFTELWIPVDDVADFQFALRRKLQPWLNEDTYHKRAHELSYAVTDWYKDSFGLGALDDLLLWMRHIYLFEGPDRIAETMWNIVPYRAPDIASEFPDLTAIFKVLDQVRQSQERKTQEFEERLLDKSQLSAWDANAARIQYVAQENLDIKINLMVAYNIFLASWEECCGELTFDQLQAMFQVGRRVAETRQMQDLEIAFPGSWRFEIRKLVERFVIM